MGVAVAVQGILPGGHPGLFQPGAGGADGFGLHVKGQHPPGGTRQAAEEGGVPPPARRGVHAEVPGPDGAGQEVVDQGQGVGGHREHQPCPPSSANLARSRAICFP